MRLILSLGITLGIIGCCHASFKHDFIRERILKNLNSTAELRAIPISVWWEYFNTFTTRKPSIPISNTKKCDSCQCGAPNSNRRIVGGQETTPLQYPWVAMLLHSGRFYCGATLINNLYVMTASHCVQGFRREGMTLRFLQHNRYFTNAETIERSVVKVNQHPRYEVRTFNNDIAILKLNKPIAFSDNLRPACLPTAGESFAGDVGIITGWGALSESGQTSATLQEVLVPIITNEECLAVFPGAVTDNMFCAGYKMGKKDACQGDSGGPLHVLQKGQYQVAGIVSWGDGCARPDTPGVYTKVNRYLQWIRSVTSDACYC